MKNQSVFAQYGREDKQKEHLLLNRKKWDKRARNFDQKFFDYFRVFQKRVIDHMNPGPGVWFLDIGCGTGWAVQYAYEKCRQRGNFFGIDLSPQMILRACTLDKTKALHFSAGDAHRLEFDKNTFDFILCTNSFHHYLNPLKAVEEVCRVLKPHGMFYLLDPGCDGLFMRLVNARLKHTEKEHISFYTKKQIGELFSRAGLLVKESRYLFTLLRLDVGKKENY
jgi:ubiquinone/menaquinone biosynthesis C-methylase UbiE